MATKEIGDFAQRGLRLFPKFVAVEAEINALYISVPAFSQHALQPALACQFGDARVGHLDDLQSVAVASGFYTRACADAEPPLQRQRIVFVIEEEKLGVVAVIITSAGGMNCRDLGLSVVHNQREHHRGALYTAKPVSLCVVEDIGMLLRIR